MLVQFAFARVFCVPHNPRTEMYSHFYVDM
jgi:hypothetical protein